MNVRRKPLRFDFEKKSGKKIDLGTTLATNFFFREEMFEMIPL